MAKVMTKSRSQEFKLHAPQAKRVSLVGTFNNWDIKANPAKKDSTGNWMLKVSLKPGKYEYKFYVDGSWINDPRCASAVYNPFGTQNSIVEIK
ncbi:MAG: glycoside hydrolase [Candidatus Omnitrophota bacterium]|jgi:1,4-alpha-glucan branching enzyme|nr:MAG: glycoside hydrolase [Candidatus Omnitrophota bacterium]